MNRRNLLSLTGGSLAALAGCIRLNVSATGEVNVTPMTYLVGAAEAEAANRREVYPSDITPENDIPDALRAPLQQARKGEFVTDAVSADLLKAIDEFRDPKDNYRLASYVRLNETAYVFEARVPTLVVELDAEVAEDYDPDRVFRVEWLISDETDLAPAVESVVERIRYRGPNAPRLPYRLSFLPESVKQFLDTYDYIEDSKGVSRIETERLHWDPPYTIGVQRLTDEERYRNPVIDLQTLNAEGREFLRDVITSSREHPSPPYVTDSVPDSYFRHLQPDGDIDLKTDPLVSVGNSVYYVTVVESEHDRVPVTVSVESVSPGENDQQSFRMTVEAPEDAARSDLTDDASIELFGHVGLPSVLWLEDGDDLYLLRSDAYEYPVESQRRLGTSTEAALVLTAGSHDLEVLAAEAERSSTEWSLDIGTEQIRETTVFETLSVGDELSATYEIPETVPSGTYNSRGFFGVRWTDRTSEFRNEAIYPFGIELTVESMS